MDEKLKALKAIGKASLPSKSLQPLQNAKKWLMWQALWQIYLPAPKQIPRPKFHVPTPNKVHQADLLFFSHDSLGGGRGQRAYKYVLTVVDVGSERQS